MGRRGRNSTRPADERSSIGDHYVAEACKALNMQCQKTVSVMTHYEPTREATLPMLFDDHVIDKMHAVRGMVTAQNNIVAYEVRPGVKLFINYSEARLPAIDATMLRLDREITAVPLLEHVAAVKAVHDRFEEVKAVLRWCNRHCTPGAIRYNFPQALSLCRDAPALRDLNGVPTRHVNPPNISSWVQPIKDAAATLAQMAMLPDDIVTRDKRTMWLTFAARTVHLTLDGHYETDAMTYNL